MAVRMESTTQSQPRTAHYLSELDFQQMRLDAALGERVRKAWEQFSHGIITYGELTQRLVEVSQGY